MPRITPIHWKKLVCVFKKAGFKFERQEGSHMIYSKPGIPRPVVIPKYNEIDVGLIKKNLKSACMTRDEYFSLLGEC
ncbi:MAG TPA: type II toxin-antitoxin system HicA family toxin [Nitrospirae bacterium]|nr:type II toxin-antitoxin system HicA family toxin [Nitrospirota bacterium]